MMLSYEKIFKFLYPLYQRLIGRDGEKVFLSRRRTQYLPVDEIEKIQIEKLKHILINASADVPYYRKHFLGIEFDPSTLKAIEEFKKINFFIDKNIVRNNVNDFLSEQRKDADLNWHRTGGSTGTPLNFPTDKPTDAASASAIMKALNWWGIELGARHAMFWGSPSFIARRKRDHLKQILNGIKNRLMNRLFFLNYDIGEHNVEKIYRDLEKFKPEYIRGMPTSLAVFAKLAKKKGLYLNKGRPKLIHSACEQLFDWQKEVIEEVLGAPVVNTYGLSELGDIAYEAPCGNLHVMDEDVLIELFEYGAGEKEVVATQLNNLSSPLIRYRTGDIAESIERCGCGLNSKILKGLKGRAHDFLLSPTGKFLHGQFLTHIIVFENEIQKYQVVQKAIDKLVIKIVVDKGCCDSSLNRIRQSILSYMGDVSVEFSIVEDIPLTPAGKYRWIISELGNLDEYI